MGCDGGTIPRRDELVITKKRPERKDKDAELFFRWRMCALSQTPLQEPVVTCPLGRLYNKEAVLQKMIDRASGTSADAVAHIKNMKDIKVVNLTPNPSFKRQSADKGDVYIDRSVSPYICPVVGIEMNGKFKFIALWSCGCVLSEKSIKEMKTDICHKCQKPFLEDDIIVLNAAGEDLEHLEKRLAYKKVNGKGEKKKSDKRKAGESSSMPEKKVKNSEDKPKSEASMVTLKSCKQEASGSSITNEVYKSIFTSDIQKRSSQTDWITHTSF
ncbi:replication termination factor 2-like [Artemia franciscana]|uniref:Replication termination factor 2 n=1 Tax=Artemia franciscana TaxID=6661 RepID=A0AA88I900_ARTSF|nr:hypothetical protein QYM36_002126 [Artemia franciscana]